jgi:hypothetical protein
MANKYVRRPDGQTSSIPHDFVVNFNYDINANAVDNWAYIADGPCEVVSIHCVPTVAGSDAGAVTAAVKKASGTTAPGSGTAVMTDTFNLKGTANTLQTATMSTTKSTRELAANDRVGIDFTGTLTAAVGLIQIRLKRIQGAGSEK